MDLETKFKKETGFDAYENNNSRPKVPSDYYVEWLEEQLTLAIVSKSFYCECNEPLELRMIPNGTPYCEECGKNIKQ